MRASPFETLQKILRLEREKGYANHAVVGGLSGYANSWVSQAATAARSADQRQQIDEIAKILKEYDALTPPAREANVREVIQILHRSPSDRVRRSKEGGADLSR